MRAPWRWRPAGGEAGRQSRVLIYSRRPAMAKDGRALREEAAAAVAAGKHKRALAAYLELERLEANDAQWAKRAGETYRRLGNNSNAIEAFERSAERRPR